MPSRERTLVADMNESKVIERDGNIHSRQQRQLDLLLDEIILLIQKVRALEEE